MSKRYHLLALPLIPLAIAASSQGGRDQRTAAAEELLCEIRTVARPGGAELEGVVVGRKPLSGTYQFTIAKTGPAGSSDTAQSGEFSISPGEERVLAEVHLGLDRGASYTAELRLRWRGGEASCVKRSPPRA